MTTNVWQMQLHDKKKKKKGLGGQEEEEREQGDKGAEERSPASGIPQLIILLKANKNKT